MVRHVVLFKLKPDVPLDEKKEIMLRFKNAIEALPAHIDFIRKVEVGINLNPAEHWDLALYSEFDSLEDVKAYSVHPEHVKAAGILADVKIDRACVDY